MCLLRLCLLGFITLLLSSNYTRAQQKWVPEDSTLYKRLVETHLNFDLYKWQELKKEFYSIKHPIAPYNIEAKKDVAKRIHQQFIAAKERDDSTSIKVILDKAKDYKEEKSLIELDILKIEAERIKEDYLRLAAIIKGIHPKIAHTKQYIFVLNETGTVTSITTSRRTSYRQIPFDSEAKIQNKLYEIGFYAYEARSSIGHSLAYKSNFSLRRFKKKINKTWFMQKTFIGRLFLPKYYHLSKD